MPPTLNPDVTVQQVGDESLLLNLKSGQIHQLNATATWILEQCDGKRTLDTISDDFAAYFSVDPETAAHDVATSIEQLSRVGVVLLPE
jgi:hypothetical protein